jgi:hypothetical protein
MIASRAALRFAVATLPVLLPALAAPVRAATERPLQSVVKALQPVSGAGDVTFIVGGDNRPTAKGAPTPRVVKTIFDEIGLVRPDFVLWSGDTVYGYCDTRAELEGEYNAFIDLATRGAVPLFNAPGNHEIHSDQKNCPSSPEASTPAPELCGPPSPHCSEEVFEQRFGKLYGSFDYAGAHFISLDTDFPVHEDEISGKQLEWLQKDLELNKSARAIFVFCHTEFHSAPMIDPNKSHPPLKNAAELRALFKNYPVKAVFAGHEHIFWREPTEPGSTAYFVAGGAGAPLYAPPDHGGYSHYILVRLTADNQATYEVIEPGRLYVEPAAGTPTEARLWIVNSTDIGPLNLHGVETEVPASLGACGELTASASLPKRDGTTFSLPLSIASCTPGTIVNKLRLKVEGMPAGTSLPVVIRRKG